MVRVRSQVSLFILVGLVIFSILAFLLFVFNPDLRVNEMDDGAILYMESCIEEKAFKSLLMAGKTGGKFENEFLFTSNLESSELFTLEELEGRVEEFFLNSVKSCKNENISGNEVFMNETNVSVSLEDRVSFDVRNPYSLVSSAGVYHHDRLLFYFDLRFNEIYEIIEHVLDNKPVVSDKGPMKNEGFKIEFIELEDNIICAITDTLSSRDYVFIFAFEK